MKLRTHTDHTEKTVLAASSRRRFLRATAATGVFVGFSGLAGAQAQSKSQTIRLGGEISGWQGRAPESIAGETNPTLQLEAGRTYRITWENVDGQPHNVALLDDGGNTLKRTNIITEQGAMQTLEFTATKAMAEYLCEVHPTSMRGDISFGEEPTQTSTETPSADDFKPLIPKGASVRIETIADGGLTAPLDFAVPPGGTRKFIADRLGQVYVHDAGGLREEPFIDVSDQLVEITGEMGLLGMAFHPKFQENRKFYLRYSAPPREGTPESYNHTEVLAEFTASEDFSTGELDSERALLEIPWPEDTHCAGAIMFGLDNYLYMGTGDGGGAHDIGLGHADDWYERFPGGNGQDVTENLLGSILRIDVDNREDGKPYAIPDSNPLVGKPGLDEQFAWGFRNPWRMGFSNDKLFAADVGQNLYEEVNIVQKDKNYGWNVREGTHCFKPGPEGSRNPPEECPTKLPPDVRGGERLIPPIIEYPHSYKGHGIGSAAIGGYIYENSDIPSIQGKYVFSDFRKTKDTEVPTGSLFVATPAEEGQWPLKELTIENTETGLLGGYVLAIGRDNTGSLYVLTTNNPGSGATGAVHRIRPSKNPSRTSGTTTANTTTTATTTMTNATTTNANTTAASVTTAGTTQTTGTPGTTETSRTVRTETNRRTTTATESANGTTGGSKSSVSADRSNGSGPGFGVVAALSGLALGAARLLAGRDD